MPWLSRRTFRLKKKHKIRKADISEPKDFRHCYHASFNTTADEFTGLPPQWACLVSSNSPKASRPQSKEVINSSRTSKCNSQSSLSTLCDTTVSTEQHLNAKNSAQQITEEQISSITDTAQLKSQLPQSVRSSKVSLSSNNSLTLVKRPSPIIRGSDGCLEETIKYIRKFYRSSSHETKPTTQERAGVTPEEEFIDIHFGSRSRTGSLLQLRTSPTNHGNVVSYTSSSTGTVHRHNDNRPPTNFCLSAPNEVVQSDLAYTTVATHQNAVQTSHTLVFTLRAKAVGTLVAHVRALQLTHVFDSTDSHTFFVLFSCCTTLRSSVLPSRPLHPQQQEHPDMAWHIIHR